MGARQLGCIPQWAGGHAGPPLPEIEKSVIPRPVRTLAVGLSGQRSPRSPTKKDAAGRQRPQSVEKVLLTVVPLCLSIRRSSAALRMTDLGVYSAAVNGKNLRIHRREWACPFRSVTDKSAGEGGTGRPVPYNHCFCFVLFVFLVAKPKACPQGWPISGLGLSARHSFLTHCGAGAKLVLHQPLFISRSEETPEPPPHRR